MQPEHLPQTCRQALPPLPHTHPCAHAHGRKPTHARRHSSPRSTAHTFTNTKSLHDALPIYDTCNQNTCHKRAAKRSLPSPPHTHTHMRARPWSQAYTHSPPPHASPHRTRKHKMQIQTDIKTAT